MAEMTTNLGLDALWAYTRSLPPLDGELMTPEGKVKDKVKITLATMGAYYCMPATGGFGNSGIPDILCCYKGRFIAIECKTGSNKPTRLQQAHLSEIELQGGIAFVINEDNVKMLRQMIEANI
jgi:hypothetical protein